MTTYVLVHGAFGGAHTWRHVRPALLAEGHDVFTPALTGIGERSHLTSPQVRLDTHVEDVVNLVLYWDLRDVVLLGYSYGGRVVSASVRFIADRIAHLVYLDTNLPTVGMNMSPAGITLPATGLGAPRFLEAAPLPVDFYDDSEVAAFHAVRRTPQPANTFLDGFVLERALEEYSFSRTFIKGTAGGRTGVGASFWDAAEYARSSEDWQYHELDTNHAIPENRPEGLSKILLGLA